MSKDVIEIFSSSEYEEAYQDIKYIVTIGKYSVKEPTAIVLGGQPGSGKGNNIYPVARERFDDNIVELDCDKFRKNHPKAEQLNLDSATYGEKTNPFVYAVVDRLVEELSEQKYNMIIESTMSSPGTALWVYDTLSPKGYKIEAQIMAVSKELSWKGVVDRYNKELANSKTARMVPKEFHDLVVENLPNSADAVYKSGKMSNMLVFNRNKEILYDMSKTPELSPKELLHSILHEKEEKVKPKSFEMRELSSGFTLKETQTDRLRMISSELMDKSKKKHFDIER